MFQEGQRFTTSGSTRIYRNLRMAALLGGFALVVLALILSSALSASTPAAARAFGLTLAAALALYVGRALLVEVRVSPDGVVVRNILRTYKLPWAEIAAVRPEDALFGSLFPGSFVGFTLTDGRLIRPQALRRSPGDAEFIARDISRLASSHGRRATPN